MSTKSHIIDTALDLFSRDGYEKTSIRQIAKTAEISLGLMYNYFKSKEDLLQHIFLEGIADIKATFTLPSQSETVLSDLINNIFGGLHDKRKHWRLIHSLRMQDASVKPFEAVQEEMKSYILTELSMMLEHMGYRQPMQEAILLYASIDGLIAHYLLNEKFPISRMTQLLIDKYQAPQQG